MHVIAAAQRRADGRADHRWGSRRGGSVAAWRASAQRVSVGDSSSSAGSFFYIVLGARAESLAGLRLSLDSVGGLCCEWPSCF